MYMFQSLIEDLRKLLPSYRRKMEKQNMRAILQQKRRILSDEDVARCSDEVVQQITNNDIYKKAKTVMFYYPVEHEIDVLGLAELNPEKCFLLPVTHRKSIEVRIYLDKDNLQPGKFGIPEPQTEEYKGKIDLVIVPGVGFDKRLFRLGRGGGYYDRFISTLRYTKKIGVGYHFQLVNKIPHQHHDEKMNEVILAKSK